MDWCTSRKPEQATASYWDSYRSCYARATDRGFENEDRRDYIERCLEGGRNVDSNLWQTYQQCFETADDRKLGGDAREDYVNRCVSRGDQKAYDSMATRTRSCSTAGTLAEPDRARVRPLRQLVSEPVQRQGRRLRASLGTRPALLRQRG